MSVRALYEGMPLDDSARALLSAAYPSGTISTSRGRHYETEEKFLYLVRTGPRAVAVPRMAYGAAVSRALLELYGEGERLVGEADLSEACGHHS